MNGWMDIGLFGVVEDWGDEVVWRWWWRERRKGKERKEGMKKEGEEEGTQRLRSWYDFVGGGDCLYDFDWDRNWLYDYGDIIWL